MVLVSRRADELAEADVIVRRGTRYTIATPPTRGDDVRVRFTVTGPAGRHDITANRGDRFDTDVELGPRPGRRLAANLVIVDGDVRYRIVTATPARRRPGIDLNLELIAGPMRGGRRYRYVELDELVDVLEVRP